MDISSSLGKRKGELPKSKTNREEGEAHRRVLKSKALKNSQPGWQVQPSLLRLTAFGEAESVTKGSHEYRTKCTHGTQD